MELPRVGRYNSICGNCHIRGHRSDGNKKNDKCNAPPCTSYFMYGQKKKHSEHFEEIKKRKRELKEVTREIEKVNMEKKNLEAFQSKSISAFATAVTQRLLKAFPEKYSPRTPGGKLALQKDIATLRIDCNNKIPSVADDERNMFLELLEKQRQLSALEINPISVQIHSSNCNESCIGKHKYVESPFRSSDSNSICNIAYS